MPINNHKVFDLSSQIGLTEMDEICRFFYESASDIFLQSRSRMMARIDGRIVRISKNTVSEDSVIKILELMTSNSRYASVMQGNPQSFAHRIVCSDGVKRFRVQAKSVQTKMTVQSPAMVLRPIPLLPPNLYEMNLPKALLEGLMPPDGLILISGPTGSGKTTLLASIMMEWLRNSEGKNVSTLEDPLEFNLHNLPPEENTGYYSPTEKGANFTTFAEGMKSLLRENPDVIMCGELRDNETIMLAGEASQTGHSVYATVHTNSAAGTFARMALQLKGSESNSFLAANIDSARVFVHQRLVNGIGGGRVPIIEWVVFKRMDRIKMLAAFRDGGVGLLTQVVQDIVEETGQPLAKSAKEACDDGKITLENYQSIARNHGLEIDAAQKEARRQDGGNNYG